MFARFKEFFILIKRLADAKARVNHLHPTADKSGIYDLSEPSAPCIYFDGSFPMRSFACVNEILIHLAKTYYYHLRYGQFRTSIAQVSCKKNHARGSHKHHLASVCFWSVFLNLHYALLAPTFRIKSVRLIINFLLF